MKLSLKTRQQLIAKHPGVRVLDHRVQCTARATTTNRQCKNWAYWHFTPCRSSTFATVGDYCYGHLTDRGIYSEEGEYQRTRKFVERLKAKGEWPSE